MYYTHEQFVQAVRQAVLETATLEPAELAKLAEVKLMYGVGQPGIRGVTIYSAWKMEGEPDGNGGKTEKGVDIVEICAVGEQNAIQVAGTTVHELGHVLAGWSAAHGKEWKDATARLGLRLPKAAGHQYMLSYFEPRLRRKLLPLMRIADGSPDFVAAVGIKIRPPKPCTAGIGTRGGTSRGKGSGSRLVKVVCLDHGYIARTTRKWLDEMGPPLCPCGEAMHVEAK